MSSPTPPPSPTPTPAPASLDSMGPTIGSLISLISRAVGTAVSADRASAEAREACRMASEAEDTVNEMRAALDLAREDLKALTRRMDEKASAAEVAAVNAAEALKAAARFAADTGADADRYHAQAKAE